MKLRSFSEFITESNKEFEDLKKEPIKITFVGDIIMHGNIESMDNNPFSNIQGLIKRSDIAVCNLESSLTSNGSGNLTEFSTNETFATLLKNAGFTHVSTSNNHVLDGGVYGIQETEDILIKNGLNILPNKGIIEVNDYKLEIYNFTTHINNKGPADIVNKLTNYTNPVDITADFNIAFAHWCNIDQSEIDRLTKSLSVRGYKIVVGSGTHKVGDVYEDDNDNIIAPALGDIFNNNDKSTGAILTLELENTDIVSAIVYHTNVNEDGIITVIDRDVII